MDDTVSGAAMLCASGRGRRPDNEIGNACNGEQNCGDQNKEAQLGELFAFRRVMGDLEKEEEKAGYGEKNEPDWNAC